MRPPGKLLSPKREEPEFEQMVVVDRRRCLRHRAVGDDANVQPTARTSACVDQKLKWQPRPKRLRSRTSKSNSDIRDEAEQIRSTEETENMGRKEALWILCMALSYMGGGSGTEQKARSSPAGA